jgi:hypothetical protein
VALDHVVDDMTSFATCAATGITADQRSERGGFQHLRSAGLITKSWAQSQTDPRADSTRQTFRETPLGGEDLDLSQNYRKLDGLPEHAATTATARFVLWRKELTSAYRPLCSRCFAGTELHL